MSRRIRVANDKEELVRSLAGMGPEHVADAAFETMADALSFAALFGYMRSKRIPLGTPSKKIDAIRPEYLPAHIAEIVALMETKSLEPLSEDEDLDDRDPSRIFEEYANGGLELLNSLLRTKKLGPMRVNALIAELENPDEGSDKPIGVDDCFY